MATNAMNPVNTIALGALAALAIGTALISNGSEAPHRRPIKITAFGTLTGPVRSFGINSRAALQAAASGSTPRAASSSRMARSAPST